MLKNSNEIFDLWKFNFNVCKKINENLKNFNKFIFVMILIEEKN